MMDSVQQGFDLRRSVRELVGHAAETENEDALVERIATDVRSRLLFEPGGDGRQAQAESLVNEAIDQVALQRELRHEPFDSGAVRQKVLQKVLGLGVIDEYRAMPGVTEVIFNGTRSAWVYRGDERLAVPPLGAEELSRAVELLLRESGQTIGPLNPLVDARLGDSRLRINIVDKSINQSGYGITLRVFPEKPLSLDELVERGTLSTQAAEFLMAMQEAHANMVIAGGTSSGKTTTLCALTDRIPGSERVIFIENPAELPHANPNHTVWETRKASSEGGRTVTVGELIVNAMRARPDRIVVSEVRDGAALEMMEAMGTGHEGSYTTLHANDARDVFQRLLSLMYMGMRHDMPQRMLTYKLYSALDLVIFQREVREPVGDGHWRVHRQVTEIDVVSGLDRSTGQVQTGELFRYDGEGLRCLGGELSPRLIERCRKYGVPVPRLLREGA